MRKKIVSMVFIGWASITMFAQQEPQFTQYFENNLFVNPAYAGSKGNLYMSAIHREQWVGFDGAPRSSAITLHSPLKYESVGLGLSLVNDQIGPMNQTMAYVDFSYTLRFKKERKLAFGVKGGINNVSLNTTQLNTIENFDPKLMQNARNRVISNFGVGVYYHTPRFFIGLSTPRFLEQTYNDVETNLERRHYFGIIGGVFNVGKQWKLRTTAQTKMVVGAPASIDLSATWIFDDRYWLGLTYRVDAAVGAFFQLKVTDQFKVGIASDFGTQRLQKYNSGTFEALLSYDFNFKKQGIRSPRYF